MTTEEQIADLQGQIDELTRQLKELREKEKLPDIKKFEDIKFYPQLKVGTLILKFIKQAAEPTPLANEIVLWQDTDDNKTYLTVNFGGIINSVELT